MPSGESAIGDLPAGYSVDYLPQSFCKKVFIVIPFKKIRMRARHTIVSFLLIIILTPGYSQQPKLMLPIGHSERVVLAKFSPDGKLALTVSTDGTAKLWE